MVKLVRHGKKRSNKKKRSREKGSYITTRKQKPNESTSKLKEGREVYLYQLVTLQIQYLHTLSLSFTLMAKTKTRRSKLKQLQFLATKHKLQLYSLDLVQLKTPGGIYRHQGKGGHVGDPWPEAQVRARRKGRENAPRATFSQPCQGGARLASGSASPSLSPVHLISLISDLMPQANKISSLQSMATWQAFNHQLNGDLGLLLHLHTMDLGSSKQGFICRILHEINMRM